MYAAPSPKEMFSDAGDATEVVTRFEDFKASLRDAHTKTARGEFAMGPGQPAQTVKAAPLDVAERLEKLTKSLSADQLSSVQSTLDSAKAVIADLAKDWTETNPFATGPVPFDLEAPSKKLVPHMTPLRNSIPRTRGQGEAARFKRLLGISNSSTGGVADLSPFIQSSTQSVAFGPTNYRRGPKISYAADEHIVTYEEMGLSDQVDWRVNFASRGFEDVRQLSQTALMWATMLGEEKAMLYSRGSGSGYSGALTPVATPTLAVAAAGAGQTGNSADIPTLYVAVCAGSGFGDTPATNVASTTALSAATGDVVNVTFVDSPGALYYDVFAGTVAGALYYSGRVTSGTTYTINFTGTGTGGAPASGAQPPAADASASAIGYDGLLTVLADPSLSGYTKVLNAPFGTATPGAEFQTAFTTLWETVRAEPDEIWLTGAGRVALSNLLQSANGNSYRINIENAGGGTNASIGQMVTGIENAITGKMVDFRAHPFMPAGCAIINSKTVPIPDSEVSSTVEMRMVQDMMAVDWPVLQFTYDSSTYMLGSMIHYAPSWSGSLTGIQAA